MPLFPWQPASAIGFEEVNPSYFCVSGAGVVELCGKFAAYLRLLRSYTSNVAHLALETTFGGKGWFQFWTRYLYSISSLYLKAFLTQRNKDPLKPGRKICTFRVCKILSRNSKSHSKVHYWSPAFVGWWSPSHLGVETTSRSQGGRSSSIKLPQVEHILGASTRADPVS